jgi:hypothetical protein
VAETGSPGVVIPFRDAAACEFDLVFETFFRSTLPLTNTAEIPEQAASA